MDCRDELIEHQGYRAAEGVPEETPPVEGVLTCDEDTRKDEFQPTMGAKKKNQKKMLVEHNLLIKEKIYRKTEEALLITLMKKKQQQKTTWERTQPWSTESNLQL